MIYQPRDIGCNRFEDGKVFPQAEIPAVEASAIIDYYKTYPNHIVNADNLELSKNENSDILYYVTHNGIVVGFIRENFYVHTPAKDPIPSMFDKALMNAPWEK